jgi:hypothetical protein
LLKSFTAVTREIDDPQAAADEIVSALAMEQNLLKNSLGIISCFSEFVETGALKAVCDALPFDCIGATTCISAAAGETDQVMLTVTVLTSDDCNFNSALIPVAEDYKASIESVCKPIMEQAAETPALLLSFFPLINNVSGDMILETLDGLTGGIPLFGTTAVDHNMDYHTAMTIHNGEAYRDMLVLGGIHGSVEVTYEIASLNESKIRNQKAIITASEGNLLTGVNGKPALQYFEEIGLTKADLLSGLGIVPLVIDHLDGTKFVARAVFTLTPDDKAVCGGAMPAGTTMGIGSIDMNDVLTTTENTLRKLKDDDSVLLCYSCIARFLALGVNSTGEADMFTSVAGDSGYLFAYSGGEICPLPNAEGKLRNFYHNYTAVFCRLK